MVELSEIVQALWEQTGDIEPTEHQRTIQSQLDPSANLRIYGEIGVGKTFTIRNYLQANNIDHEYFTAREVAKFDRSDFNSGVFKGVQTIVIDNFDVVPERRDDLDEIYQLVELYMESISRGVWMLFPSDYHHDWFNSVLTDYTELVMKRSNINPFTIDKVRSNIDIVTDKNISIGIGDVAVREFGYHDVVKSCASE